MTTTETDFKPFQASGQISPGNGKFFGRREELSFIRSNLRSASILIVGGRKIGKTSLLNQALDWSQKERGLEPFYVELLKVSDQNGFSDALNGSLLDTRNSTAKFHRSDTGITLEELVRQIEARGHLPVFLFNEIDGLAGHELLREWAELDAANRARFIMVGCSIVAELGTEGSLLGFSTGTSFGGRALAPTVLSRKDAEGLLGRLTARGSHLRWKNVEEQREAFRLLLDRSYRIPRILQFFGQALWRRLNGENIVRLSDVKAVLAQMGDEVLRSIEDFDYESFDVALSREKRVAYKLILYCMARKKYFRVKQEGKKITEMVKNRSALDAAFAFTAKEAKSVVTTAVSEILADEQLERAQRGFQLLDFHRTLKLLTLTLALKVDPDDEQRFGFLMHLFPLELERSYGQDDPFLDHRIRKAAE